MQPSIIKRMYPATPKIKAPRHQITKTQKLHIQLRCNVAHPLLLIVQSNVQLLAQNTASPGKALIPNGQGTEGIIAKLRRLILGMGGIWGLEKNSSEKSDDMGFKKCTLWET